MPYPDPFNPDAPPIDPGPNASWAERQQYQSNKAYYDRQHPSGPQASAPAKQDDWISRLGAQFQGGIANAKNIRDSERNKQFEDLRTHRERDFKEGRARGEEVFGNGALGRVQEGRPDEVSDILARREAESEGFSPEEQNAFRTQHQTENNQALAGKLRALKIAQAQSGVRGGLAGAQQAQAIKDSNIAGVNNERELFLKNIDARRAGLSSHEQSLGAARKDELERQTYNQGQVNKEKLGQLGTELGYGSLGSGERAGLFQLWAGQENAAATRAAAKQGGGGCCFIFLEARYGTGAMDSVVRRFRDSHMTAQNCRGYYKVSEVLVPLMRKSKLVKFLVRLTLTDPMVAYGKAFYGEGSKLGLIFKPVATAWIKLFDFLGGEHPFIRENGEVI